MAFEQVLERVGGFGFYQKMFFFLLSLASMDKAWQMVAMTFLGANMDHWCKVDRLQQFSPEHQKYISIPTETNIDGATVYSKCAVFPLDYTNLTDHDLRTWNRSERTAGLTPVACGAWNYDHSVFISTIISQFDLVCNNAWLVPLTNTIYMGGIAVGVLIFGSLSDRFGRMKTYMLCLFLQFVGQILAAFSVHYAMFVTLRFFSATATLGAHNCIFVMIMEIIGTKYRTVCAAAFSISFATGFAIFPGMAYFVRDHQKLQLVMGIPIIVFFSYWWILSESPRWLVSQGRIDEATEILKRIADINGTTFPEDANFGDDKPGPGHEEVVGISHAFRRPNLRKRTLALSYVWFTVSMVYYGVSLGAKNLAGDLFLNTFLLGVTGLPSTAVCIFVLLRFGRRPVLSFFLSFGGVMCLACIPFFFFKNLRAGVTVFSILGKMGINVPFTEVFIYTTELYPTSMRNAGLGATSMWARISSMVAPFVNQLVNVWRPLPSIVFGGLAVTAALVGLLLPETKGKRLPETLDEGEAFGTVHYEEVLGRRASSANLYAIQDKDVSMQQDPSSQINEGFQDEQDNGIQLDLGETSKSTDSPQITEL